MRIPCRIGLFFVYLSNEVLPASSLFSSKLHSNIFRPRAVSKMADEMIALDLLVQKDVKIKKSRKAIISTVITVSYMSIIVSVMALPVCLSAISSDIAFYGAKTNKSYLSEVIFSATMAIMVGKFVLGPVTDLIGGDATMQGSMLVMALLLYACATCSKIQTFGMCWIVLNFVYASAWGAVSKIVRTKFNQAEWAKVIGQVAAGSRLGSLGSSLLYGTILRAGIAKGGLMEVLGLSANKGEWRIIFKVSAIIQAATLLIYVLCDKCLLSDNPSASLPSLPTLVNIANTSTSSSSGMTTPTLLTPIIFPGSGVKSVPAAASVDLPATIQSYASNSNIKKVASDSQSDEEVVESISEVLSRISRDPRFWLMLAGKVSLMAVGQFISFIPLYLTTGHRIADGEAAAKSAVFAMGSLLSSIFGSRVYQNISGKMQVQAVTVCNLFGFLLPALLIAHHYTGPLAVLSTFVLTQRAVLVILGLWGMAWALPFYLPAGVLALTLGGVTHAALLTNLFDAAGFLMASVFSYYAMELGRQGTWVPLMSTLSCAGCVALCTMSRSMTLSLPLSFSEKSKRRGD